MKLVCLSDTHASHRMVKDVPKGDIFVYAGDFMGNEMIEQAYDFGSWSYKLNFDKYILVPGNHDICIEKNQRAMSDILNHFDIFVDKKKIINKYVFYGTPYQPYFNGWAFNIKDENERERVFNKIPDNVEILITHIPPYGILDTNQRGEHIGDPILLNRIQKLKHLQLHIFGHNHHGYGILDKVGVKYVNASLMNENYDIVNKPITIDI